MSTIKQQIRENIIAIISLIVAIAALYHNERLYELSERNRNIRLAAFEVLMHLGELQQVVNSIHYNDQSLPNAIMLGWGHVALIGDLSTLIPAPVPKAVQELILAWKQYNDQIKEESAADAISDHINQTREAILKAILQLG